VPSFRHELSTLLASADKPAGSLHACQAPDQVARSCQCLDTQRTTWEALWCGLSHSTCNNSHGCSPHLSHSGLIISQLYCHPVGSGLPHVGHASCAGTAGVRRVHPPAHGPAGRAAPLSAARQKRCQRLARSGSHSLTVQTSHTCAHIHAQPAVMRLGAHHLVSLRAVRRRLLGRWSRSQVMHQHHATAALRQRVAAPLRVPTARAQVQEIVQARPQQTSCPWWLLSMGAAGQAINKFSDTRPLFVAACAWRWQTRALPGVRDPQTQLQVLQANSSALSCRSLTHLKLPVCCAHEVALRRVLAVGLRRSRSTSHSRAQSGSSCDPQSEHLVLLGER